MTTEVKPWYDGGDNPRDDGGLYFLDPVVKPRDDGGLYLLDPAVKPRDDDGEQATG